MFRVQRTSNLTHPISLMTDSESVLERSYVLTEEARLQLISDLIDVGLAPPQLSAAAFSDEQVAVMRQIVRNEISDMILGKR